MSALVAGVAMLLVMVLVHFIPARECPPPRTWAWYACGFAVYTWVFATTWSALNAVQARWFS